MSRVREKPSTESLDIYGKRSNGIGSAPTVDYDPAHPGVKAIEASHKVFGEDAKLTLFVCIGFAAYIYSLDNTTTPVYLAAATTQFQGQALMHSMLVVQLAIVSVAKPAIAKVADVTSRGSAFAYALFLYVIGCIIIASASNARTVAAGVVFYALGNIGLTLLTQIIIADMTTLKWRGLASSLVLLPNLINAFVSADVAANVISGASWRVGFGMFAIVVPVVIVPFVFTLLRTERKALKLGFLESDTYPPSIIQRVVETGRRFDIPGLLLFCFSVSLIKISLILSATASGAWANGSIVGMMVIGCILIPTFLLYDVNLARFPVVSGPFVANTTVAAVSVIGTLTNASFNISYTLLNSFVLIVKPWSAANTRYFGQTQTAAIAFFGVVAGVLMRRFRRYKMITMVGVVIRLLGIGIMINSRGADGPNAEIAWAQLLQGMGAGLALTSSRVGAQASVPHADIAITTAFVLLLSDLGEGIGIASAEAIFRNFMPGKLALHLPFVSEADRTALFRNVLTVLDQPRGTPIREGVIQAYGDVMKIATIVSTVLAVLPLFLALALPDYQLDDHQNAVDHSDLKGDQSNIVENMEPARR